MSCGLAIPKEDKFKCSVNIKLIDKIDPPKKLDLARGFDAVELTFDEVIEVVTMGYAISYQFADGSRNSKNFLCTDLVLIDIDGTRRIDDAMKDPIVKKYCGFSYTTPSHSPDSHRFRLVFFLSTTVTDGSKLRAVSRSLCRRLGGDMSATDSARLFYGSSQASIYKIGKMLTDKYVDELIQDGLVAPETDSISRGSATTPSRSKLRIEPSQVFRTSSGTSIMMKDVTFETSVFCIFHRDTSPSAFLAKSKTGIFLHCSSCQLTRWMRSSVESEYDFGGFVKALREVRRPKSEVNHVSLEHFFEATSNSFIHLKPKNIHFFSTRFLSIKDVPLGMTFIRSPKGSGKTSYLSSALDSLLFTYGSSSLEAFEEGEDIESPSPIYTGTKALLIGHRRSLIRNLSSRLWLRCYLDDERQKSSLRANMDRYGICVDSLERVRDKTYDILLIDESEQVLGHFLSQTLGEERFKVFEIFKALVRSTPRVVALDADLGWTTFSTLATIRDTGTTRGFIPRSNKLRDRIQIYVNEWVPTDRMIEVYESGNHLLANLIAEANSQSRIFVASNSKAKIKAIRKALDKSRKDLSGVPLRIMEITSDTIQEEHVASFLKSVETEILNFDVVLCSPSLGTGVDISFKGDETKIDIVYGFFENQINSHMEIDQQLSRVRHPGSVRVWISPRTFNFETEFGVIEADLLHQNLREHVFPITHDSNKVFPFGARSEESIFWGMAALVFAEQRASKNHLKRNFIDYKKHNGWVVVEVSVDPSLGKMGKAIYSAGKSIVKDDEVNALLCARILDRDEYDEVIEQFVDGFKSVSASVINSFKRTKIELFYQQRISRELVLQDSNGYLQSAVARFIGIGDLKEAFRSGVGANRVANHLDIGKKELRKAKFLPNNHMKDFILYGLFADTPIFRKGQFLLGVEFCSDDLADFTKNLGVMKVYLESQFSLSVRKDYRVKPVEQLSVLLKVVGIKLEQSRKKKVAGRKIYYYQIDADSHSMMEDIANTRRKFAVGSNGPSEWKFVNELYGLAQ